MDMQTPPVPAAPAASGLDLAALAADHLTPVLGRYFERSWSPRRRPPPLRHGRQGLPRLRQRDRRQRPRPPPPARSPPPSTRRSTGSSRPMAAMGYAEPTVAPRHRLAKTLPDPIDTVFFLNSGSEADRGRPQAGPPGHRAARDRRLPGRLPRADLRRHEHHELEPQLPARLRAAPAVRLPQPVPVRLPRLRRATRSGPSRSPSATFATSSTRRSRRRGRRDRHRARPGRGRLHPGAARVPRDPAPDLRPARHPARRRRGPGGLRADREDVGVRARRDRPRRRLHRQGDRERPAALRDRVADASSRSAGAGAPTAPRTAATR